MVINIQKKWKNERKGTARGVFNIWLNKKKRNERKVLAEEEEKVYITYKYY